MLRCLNIDANTEEIVVFFWNRPRIYGVEHPRALCQHCVGHSCPSLVQHMRTVRMENPHLLPAQTQRAETQVRQYLEWHRGGFTGEKAFLHLKRNPQSRDKNIMEMLGAEK